MARNSKTAAVGVKVDPKTGKFPGLPPQKPLPPDRVRTKAGSGSPGDPLLIQYRRVKPEDNEPTAAEPIRQYDHDAGFDLTVSRHISVAPQAKALIPTNIAIDLPAQVFGLVLPRSSTMYRKGLLVHPGIIDPGYRGEVLILAWNPTIKTINVAEGDRIAQLLVLPRPQVRMVEVQALSEGDRGSEGFGSTGGLEPQA